jgi:hypothetical protein
VNGGRCRLQILSQIKTRNMPRHRRDGSGLARGRFAHARRSASRCRPRSPRAVGIYAAGAPAFKLRR